MCGFVGIANPGFNRSSGGEDRVAAIQAMMEAIRHRGPDSGQYFADEHIALGFRRLSIIDLSDEGNQPMLNEDRSCVLAFNGEIYNFRELREELTEQGHHFASRTDSEVLLHGYEEYGISGLLRKLRGMFAFALWDAPRKTLLLARDMFGIKPLYYTNNTTDGSLLFGSEIKAFLKHPAFRKELNKAALKPYLTFQYSAMEETFFKGVYKLLPGHYLRCEQGKVELQPYAELAFHEQDSPLDYYISQIKETLQSSVEYHKISDVKVGSFLSGGIDSSYITALLKPDHTFTVGFRDFEGMFNETDLAQDLSDRLSIENHKRLISAEDCFGKLPEIQYHMDEPHANLSSLPLYFLAELARKHVTVVLSGEGADELFGGYVWYRKSPNQLRYERIPYGIRRVASLASRYLPRNKLTNFIYKGGLRVEETFIGQANVFSEEDANEVLQEEYRYGPSPAELTEPYYKQVQDKDDVTKMQHLDLHLWLPGDILLKADKMSMAHSIELRVPFLDKEVMSLASRLPARYRVNEKDTKYALRAASKEVLPEEWANREKVGFPVPIRHWLREEKYYNLVKTSFQSETAREFFRTDRLVRYLDEHYAGKANRARYIWTVYVFLVWYERFFEQ